MKPKLIIEVDGGVVYWVGADREIEVYLVDHDYLRAGEEAQHSREPYVVSIVQDVLAELNKTLRQYEHKR